MDLFAFLELVLPLETKLLTNRVGTLYYLEHTGKRRLRVNQIGGTHGKKPYVFQLKGQKENS
jgi:hypothetical protein